MNITLNLQPAAIGKPPCAFPFYAMKAYWENGRIAVFFVVQRPCGSLHLTHDVIDPPQSPTDLASNTRQHLSTKGKINIAINPEKQTEGTQTFAFNSYVLSNYWEKDGRIGVLATIEAPDGIFYILHDAIDFPPAPTTI